jgi:hypothetical protein
VEDHDEANRTLVLRYLAAYGPASAPEVNRWWGIAGAGLKSILRELGDAVTEVDVDGHRGLIRSTDLRAIKATQPLHAHAVLLGPFDPLTVGAGLRERLIPAAHLKRVSRTAGWISPVVVLGGRIAGVWSGRVARDRYEITIDLFSKPNTATKRAVEAAAERVAAAYAATLRLEFAPVYRQP